MNVTEDRHLVPIDPRKLRDREFPVRLRGLDQHEVYAVLDAVAGDLEVLQAQLASLGEENERLRVELEQASVTPQERVNDQAVMLLTQAQQVADTLIEEAVQSAQDLLLTARSQQRDVLEQADHAARSAVKRAAARAETMGHEDPAEHSVEYVKTFAKVAQVQFKAVLEALNDQVERLSELADLEPDEDPATADVLDVNPPWHPDEEGGAAESR